MTKIINKQIIKDNMDYRELVEQIKQYYMYLQDGSVEVTDRLFSRAEDGGLHIIGGATNYNNNNYITMAQTVMPWKGDKGEPVATSAYLYVDRKTADIKAIVGGEDIVKYRTPAKSTLAATFLAPQKDSYTLGLIGLGIQAVSHAQAMKALFNVERIVATSRTPEKWQHNIDKIKEVTGIEIEVLSVEEVAQESDILVVITSSKEPIIEFEHLHKGQLVIGTDHAETVSRSVVHSADKVFVDYRSTAENEIATIKNLLDEGEKYENIVLGDLLQLSSDEIIGRESDDEIIFFQSLGVLNENLAAVEYLYEKVKDTADEISME